MAKLLSADKKQRVVAVLLTIVIVVLAWQVYGLFFATPEQSAPPVRPAPVPRSEPAPAKPATSTAKAAVASTTTNDDSDAVDPYQKKYLQLLEEYKILELQKMIATDKQAIAAAQAATVESINKINQMGGQANLQGLDLNSTDNTTSANTSETFSLVYTGLQDGEWMATLKQGNNSFDVSVGTVLAGKYRVNKINNNEVVLQNKDQIIHVGFEGNTTATAPEATPAAEAAAPTSTKTEPAKTENPESKTTAAPTTKVNSDGILQTPAMPKPANHVVKPVVVTPTPVANTSWYEQLWQQAKSYFGASNQPAAVKAMSNNTTTKATMPVLNNKPVATPIPETVSVTTSDAAVKPSTTVATATAADNTAKASLPPIPPLQAKPNAATATALGLTTPATPAAATTTPSNLVQSTSVTETAVKTTPTNLVPTTAAAPQAQYTIQLAMLADQQQLQQFIQEHHLVAGSYATYQEVAGSHRYGITSGNFQTREEANKALRDLAADLKQSGPYIISTEEIQQKIQATSGNTDGK